MKSIELKDKKKEIQFFQNIYRFLALGISRKIVKTKITPNQVTVFSIILGTISAVFFSFGTYPLLLAGVFLLQISILLDYVDGSLARLRSKASIFGEWLDNSGDLLIDFLVFLGIAFGVYHQGFGAMAWVLGFFAIAIRFLIFSTYSATLLFVPFAKKMLQEGVERKFLKQFVYTRMTVLALASLAGIFNQMYYFLLIVSIYGALFYLGLVILLGKKIRTLEGKR